jgi:hypothetical protein
VALSNVGIFVGRKVKDCVMPKRVAQKSMARLSFLGTEPWVTLKLGLALELNVAQGGEATC